MLSLGLSGYGILPFHAVAALIPDQVRHGAVDVVRTARVWGGRYAHTFETPLDQAKTVGIVTMDWEALCGNPGTTRLLCI